MQKATIQLIQNYYTYKGSDSRDLEILAIFLTDDVEVGREPGVDFFKNFATDPKLKKSRAMATKLTKNGDTIILIDAIDAQQNESEFEGLKDVYIGGECKLSAKAFISLLNDWKEVTSLEFEQIDLIKDGDKINLLGIPTKNT